MARQTDPSWLALAGAIAYALLPLDLVPDALPGIGLVDDAGVAGAALIAVGWWRRGRSWRDLVPLLLALVYDLSPIDAIPDVPVVGQVDDLVATAIGLAVWWWQRRAPPEPPATP